MSTAVVVVDMQNGFIHPKGSLLRSGMPLHNPESVIEQNVELLAAARAAGWPIVYTQHQYLPDYSDAPDYVREIFARVDGLVENTWDTEFLDEVRPEPDDVVIVKNRYDAFLRSDLEALLRQKGVTSLMVTGVATHACVDSTARSGFQRDFRVVVAEDCCSAEPDFHAASLKSLSGIGVEVAPWREKFGELGRPASSS